MPSRFAQTVTALSILLHAYVALRIAPAFAAPWSWLFAAAMLASALLLPLGLRFQRRARSRADERLTWVGLVVMGLFSSLVVLTILRDASLLVVAALDGLRPGALPAAAWSEASAVAVPVVAAVITVVGFFNARRLAGVRKVDVAIAGLPAALQGFTIAQITDIHVGPTIKGRFVQAIVDAVNRLDADMVAVTGDLVDGSVAELAMHVAPIGALRSRHGSFFVTGNHEYYSGANAWVRELRRLGLTALMNEHVVLQHDGEQLVLGGVTDFNGGHFGPDHESDAKAAIADAPTKAALRVLLAHQPRSADAAEAAGFDLQLSGHTHGGQFLPWNFFVKLQQPFVHGLHRVGRLQVYTSRGTGYWGPPLRFGAPSEITLLRLVSGAAAEPKPGTAEAKRT